MSRDFPQAYGPELEHRLTSMLRDLSYPAFLEVVSSVMRKCGYATVNVTRRASERNSGGGVDIEAAASAGLVPVSAIAQAKQYSAPVQKRYVDEVRGIAAARRASHALIFSTSVFSPSAISAASQDSLVQVRLVGVSELVSLMAWHRIGVVRGRLGLTVSQDYFDGLACRHAEEDNRTAHPSGFKDGHSLTLKLWFGDRTSSSESRRCGS